MNIGRVRTSPLAFLLTLFLGIVFTFLIPYFPDLLYSPLDGGPLGYRPQLVSSAKSPDGGLVVKVFRQRNPSYSWWRGAEMHTKIYDRQDKVLYEEMIGSDGAWSELDNAFEDIRFDNDVIRISQLWGRSYLIKQSELRR